MMYADIVLVVVPFLGLTIQVLTHLALSRLSPVRSPWISVFTGFCFGLLLTVIFTMMLATSSNMIAVDLIGVMLVNIGAMVALGFCYFTFVNLNYTSLRIRLLREFVTQKGQMDLSEILSKYNAQIVLAARLERLVKAGELLFNDQYYSLGTQTRFSTIGSILNWFKRTLLVRSIDRKQIPECHF